MVCDTILESGRHTTKHIAKCSHNFIEKTQKNEQTNSVIRIRKPRYDPVASFFSLFFLSRNLPKRNLPVYQIKRRVK